MSYLFEDGTWSIQDGYANPEHGLTNEVVIRHQCNNPQKRMLEWAYVTCREDSCRYCLETVPEHIRALWILLNWDK